MWYEKVYRRHLCDMHIEDWNDEFLREFSPEEYLSCLKAAHIQNAMLYFQSHVGYCYYPTESGHMHRAFIGREDAMKRLAAACRREGIFVTGYYSLNYNTWAHDQYPAWRMVQASGLSRRAESNDRYGLCCPNNPDYRAFVFEQMKEMNDYFEFDGMFFDMPFWPHMCYCEHCKKRWAEEVGGELPVEINWNSPAWLLHMKKRREWMGEFAQIVTREMKRLRPGVSVEHNFASAVVKDPMNGCAEEVNEACDYAGGDLYGGILEQSFTCKFYRNITKNQPFEYMFSRCTPNLSCHTTTKSPDQMAAAIGLTAAHHGATLVIDAIDPVGTMDRRVYERIGAEFAREMPYEKYFTGEMAADVGVYFSLRSKFRRNGRNFSNEDGCVNTVKNLIVHHIPVGVTGSFAPIEDYQAIVAPCLTEEDSACVPRLTEYVRSGGTLYFSGTECPALLEALLGARVIGEKNVKMTYVAPAEGMDFGWYNARYPLPFAGPAPLVETAPEGVLATLTFPYTGADEAPFASIHSNPPGMATSFPALIERPFGKGRVIWSALPLENESNEEYRRLLLKLLKVQPSIASDASSDTELVLFQDEKGLTLSAVTLSEEYEIRPADSFTVSLLCERKPAKVVLLPDEQPVDFTWDGERVSFTVDRFHVYAIYRVLL